MFHQNVQRNFSTNLRWNYLVPLKIDPFVFLQPRFQFLFIKYKGFIEFGYFNEVISNISINSFCGVYSLKNQIKESTGFKIFANPTCIDLMLIFYQKFFRNSEVYDRRSSDFQKLMFAFLMIYITVKKIRKC